MAFDWSTGISVAGSLLGGGGGIFGGGSKAGERAARDAAALAQFNVTDAAANAASAVRPFINTGESANRLLAQYLGIDTSGYGMAKPTRETAAAEVRARHFEKYGKDYGRNSSMGWVAQETERKYQELLKDYEKGLAKWKEENPNAMGDARLLREFTNEDFVRDPGYDFRMAEGEKGINRALAARGSFDSGAALKSLNRFNQDFASNEFMNAFNRDTQNKNTIYNFLSGQSAQGLGAATNLSGQGLNAANTNAQIGTNTSNNSMQFQYLQDQNRANSIQSAIGNLVYGMRRGNQSIVSGTPSSGTGYTNAVAGAGYA